MGDQLGMYLKNGTTKIDFIQLWKKRYDGEEVEDVIGPIVTRFLAISEFYCNATNMRTEN